MCLLRRCAHPAESCFLAPKEQLAAPCHCHVCAAAHEATAARHLQKERDWGDSADSSGLGGLVGARIFNGGRARPPARTAVTPEGAESTANAAFSGIYRPFGSVSDRVYAQAEFKESEDARNKETIRPRVRSAIDVPGVRRAPNLGSGEEQMAVLSMGQVALAETHEGAEAASASDALPMNTGKTSTAASMLIARPPPFKGTDAVKGKRTRSFAASSSVGVGSLAMAGPANGKVVLAQANEAVALSQSSTSTADQWQEPYREPIGRGLRAVLHAFMRQQQAGLTAGHVQQRQRHALKQQHAQQWQQQRLF